MIDNACSVEKSVDNLEIASQTVIEYVRKRNDNFTW